MNRRMLPFTIQQGIELDASLSGTEERVRGLVGLEDGALVLQFQITSTKTSMMSMEVTKEVSDVQELRIPFDDLAGVRVRGRWGRRLTLTANDMNAFKDVPGAKGERVDLTFARADRDDADALGASLGHALSDLGLARLDERIAKLERPDES